MSRVLGEGRGEGVVMMALNLYTTLTLSNLFAHFDMKYTSYKIVKKIHRDTGKADVSSRVDLLCDHYNPVPAEIYRFTTLRNFV